MVVDWSWGTQPRVLVRADVTWRGIVPARPAYLPMSPQKMCTQLRTASVTLAFGRTIWRGLKMSWTPTKSAMTSEFIGPMITGMVFGMNRLINKCCVKFPLVV